MIENILKLLATQAALLFTMIAILSLSLLFISSSAAFDFSRACEQGERVPVVYLQQEPLIFHDEGKTMMSGIMHEIFEKLVEECCNESTRITYEANDSSGPIGDILEKHENYLVLPVGRRSGRTQSVLNRPFISLLRSPGLAVVVMKSLSGSDLAAAIVQSWPVIIFIIMSLALAGMFVWFLVSVPGFNVPSPFGISPDGRSLAQE